MFHLGPRLISDQQSFQSVKMSFELNEDDSQSSSISSSSVLSLMDNIEIEEMRVNMNIVMSRRNCNHGHNHVGISIELNSENDINEDSKSENCLNDSIIDDHNIQNVDYRDEAAAGFSSNMVEHVGNGFANLLMERAALTDSIKWLGRHVPGRVMSDLTGEVMRIHNKRGNDDHRKKKDTCVQADMVIPHSQIYKAALLFVDISGFTKLSLMLGLESLSRVRII